MLVMLAACACVCVPALFCIQSCAGQFFNLLVEVRASQLAQASERVGSPIPASQQG